MPSIAEYDEATSEPHTGKKGREWREKWFPKGVRRVGRGRSFQQRTYIGPCRKGVYPINLGSYASEYEAGRIGREFRKLWAKGMTPWEALTALIAAGEISPLISSRWVYAVLGGWAIKARCRGAIVELVGPFKDAASARLAASKALIQLLQRDSIG